MKFIRALFAVLIVLQFCAAQKMVTAADAVVAKNKASIAKSDCNTWHYAWVCCEWYPNGKDCRRSKKIKVCDDFDVNISGHTAKSLRASDSSAKAIIELYVSPDRKTMVDQNGTVIANFVNGVCVKTDAGKLIKDLPGCMCPVKECILYDNKTGKCLKWITSSQWDFDCSCKKK